MEDIPMLCGKLFHEIDGSIHQGKHRRLRPPVAITLCGAVTGKAEWRALIQQQDILDPRLVQIICRGDACDAGAANDHIHSTGHEAGNFPFSSSQVGSTRMDPSGKMMVGTLRRPLFTRITNSVAASFPSRKMGLYGMPFASKKALAR